ncbi:MAG: metallophosphoesterase [Gemmatimonadales bacterium]
MTAKTRWNVSGTRPDGGINPMMMKGHTMSRLFLAILCASTLTVFSGCIPKKRPPTDVKPEEIESTVLFIGDAGEQDPRRNSGILDSLSSMAAEAPERTTIVFLGDNVYPFGIPRDTSEYYEDARRRLLTQVNAVPARVKAIFIPGNHDWAASGPSGLYAVRAEERMLLQMAKDRGKDIRMLPGNGCPGPATVEMGRLRLILLDTQWWLHDWIVRDERSNCATDMGVVTANLREIVKSTPDGRIAIAAGHHPMMTGGQHGGYCGITGPFRRLSGQSQDILSSLNRNMRDSLEAAFRAKPPLAYAAGHDHNLQVMKGTPSVQYLMVSGAGSASKAECAVYLRESYYVSQHRTGFMRIDVLKGKGVVLSVFDFTGGGGRGDAFSRWLEVK